MALEFASGLRRHGNRVRFVQTGSSKTPDLEVHLADRTLTLEFKALHEPEGLEPWYALERRLAIALGRIGLATTAFDLDLEFSALDNPDAVFKGLLQIA